MSALQKSVLKKYALPPRNSASGGFGRKPKDFSPVHWSQYFKKKEIIDVNGDKFCVYLISPTTSPEIPIVLLLHGGGFSALTWAVMAKELSSLIHVQIIAVDLRGHGETITKNEDDLSAETMSTDIVNIAKGLKLQDNPIILVGHSLGGSLAVHTAQKMFDQEEFNVVAVTVIDVVEGSAIESLSSMHSILKQRPTSFPTLARAVEWSMKSGVIKNHDSARVSMPGQLKSKTTNQPGTIHVINPENSPEISNDVESSSPSTTIDNLPILRSDVIMEEESETSETTQSPPPPPATTSPIAEPEPHNFQAPTSDTYVWRIDLSKTEPYWEGWFKGMSVKFLSLLCPKLLMLAGVDRLDKDLTVGQMQGKFQMHVISGVGHAVQEDSPDEVANSICSFLVRHKLVEATSAFTPVFPGC